MASESYDDYYSEKELEALVEKLNAFASPVCPWRLIRARKDHEDFFGERIKEFDDYYRFQGAVFHDTVKLSRLSMARLCFVLFQSTIALRPIADYLLQKKEKERQRVIAKLSASFGNKSKDKGTA